MTEEEHAEIDRLVRGVDLYYFGERPLPPSFDAEKVYAAVWRFDFSAPGFYLLDLGPNVDSHNLRSWMVGIKEDLSDLHMRRKGKPFIFRSMGRFDQQVTTRFHVDGSPPEALLVLGYEPSKVRSRLFLADYSRAAFDLGITPKEFLDKHNPMYRKNEEVLAPYVTELPPADEAHARILLVNNSSLPFSEARVNPLGVMHMAIIDAPSETDRRIVNSMMLVTEGEEVSPEQQAEFVGTEEISKKIEYASNSNG